MAVEDAKIKFDRFSGKKLLRKDFIIWIIFVILLFFCGILEKNLFLSGNGLGLLEHINVWIFIITNLMVPWFISRQISELERNINSVALKKLKKTFNKNANLPFTTIIFRLVKIVGFCYFVGNSLQNAHIINNLQFAYWDSIDYILSYIVSRIYKFYLFAYFFPTTLVYVYIFIQTISETLAITESDMEYYPIKNYIQLNFLCDMGLNLLLIIVFPFILLSSGIYLVHHRLDIVTISTLIISGVITAVFMYMYVLLIHNYHRSIIEYKRKHIAQIDFELFEIHKNIIKYDYSFPKHNSLEDILKRELYLRECKERILGISEFPLIIKAGVTILSPTIPTLIKLIVSTFKYFNNGG